MSTKTSLLQSVWRKVSWIIYFRLHRLDWNRIPKELDTREVEAAVLNYNNAVAKLKAAMRNSYKGYKAKVNKS